MGMDDAEGNPWNAYPDTTGPGVQRVAHELLRDLGKGCGGGERKRGTDGEVMRTNNVEAKNPSALAVQSSERKWRRRPLLGAVIPVRIICTMAGSSRWTRPGWLAMTDGAVLRK